MENQKKHVLIIGGGFSGLAVLIHLLDKTTSPLQISLIEKSPGVGHGIAFGTSSEWHPLNVRANQMGAFAHKPDHFYHWLTDNEKTWRNFCPFFESIPLSPSQFYPRKLYALYLDSLLSQAIEKGKQKNVALTLYEDEVIDIDPSSESGLAVVLKRGKSVTGSQIVLATGVPSMKKFPFESPSLLANPHYIRNIWNLSSQNLPFKNKTVLIIGSGLTAVDALLSLKSTGFQGNILVVSKSGRFPQSHMEEQKPLAKKSLIESLPSSCLSLYKQFKEDLDRFQLSGCDWRQIIDAYRPQASKLWTNLNLTSKKQFLRHLFSLWNQHRHRMSPESVGVINEMILKNQLKIAQGIIQNIEESPDKKFCVQVSFKESKNPEQRQKIISADYILNCSGPEYDLSKRQDPFFQSILSKGLIFPDDLGLGLKLDRNEILASSNQGQLFALGSLLFGEKFETTSVPEIREQASSIANIICTNQILERGGLMPL